MRPRSLLLATLLVGASAGLVVAPARATPAPDAAAPGDAAPRNLVLLIADGCGPASFTLARRWLGAPLALDAIRVGAVDTAASDSNITDSAASATAFATGSRTYNGAISVDAAGERLTTLLEVAEQRGLATGLVTTTRITHATPACFAAHVPNRGMEDEIAAQLIEAGAEVLLGGGRASFLPAPLGARADGRDLLTELREGGAQVVEHRAQLADVTAPPLVGLFAESHMAYELDRDTDPAQPSLTEMTEHAWRLLAGEPHGFLLVVEGGRIDHAGHGNDPAGHLHDLLAYDAMVARVLELARADRDTLVVSTSDHETGGLTLGRVTNGASAGRYDPRALAPVTRTIEWLSEQAGARALRPGDLAGVTGLLGEAGLTTLSGQELAAFQDGLRDGNLALYAAWRDVLGERAGLAWTTWGHTGVDVPLFADGPGAERFVGLHDNDALGRLLHALLPAGSAPGGDAAPTWHSPMAPGRLRR